MMFKPNFNCLFYKESIDSLTPYLYSGTQEECLNSVMHLKNLAVGSNKKKEDVIQSGIVPRLLHLLVHETENQKLAYEIGALLCTLSKGTIQHIRFLIDCNAIPVLIRKITEQSSPNAITEICLRTLRSIFISNLAPVNVIYEPNISGMPFIAYLLSILVNLYNCETEEKKTIEEKSNFTCLSTNILCIQECILNILAFSCQNFEQQSTLCQYSCLFTISKLLLCKYSRIKEPTLNLISQVCFKNIEASRIAINTVLPITSNNGNDKKKFQSYRINLVDQLSNLLNEKDTQLNAAKCITYLYRANAQPREPNAISEPYVNRTLKVLIKYCKSENSPEERSIAAITLAYLIELDPDLQMLAATCDQIIPTLSEYLAITSESLENWTPKANKFHFLSKNIQIDEMKKDLKESAFKCLASLGASHDSIRKKIIETDNVMDCIVQALSDPSSIVRLASLCSLHSLSRSVQQLKTSFQDHMIWVPLKLLLLGTVDDNILSVASSTLCNLLLEFSPSKEHFLDRSTVDLLCSLTKRDVTSLKLNGIWALMNMAFQAEEKIKMQILKSLGMEQIFKLLKDSNHKVIMKTLGLLRNLLSLKCHADLIMDLYGKQIMEAITYVMSQEYPTKVVDAEIIVDNEIKEQAVCIVANIANGYSSKEFVMENDEVLNRLIEYLSSENTDLQIATVHCINNLIWTTEPNFRDRQEKLEKIGILKSLQKLLHTSDDILFNIVKSALQQFNEKESS